MVIFECSGEVADQSEEDGGAGGHPVASGVDALPGQDAEELLHQ